MNRLSKRIELRLRRQFLLLPFVAKFLAGALARQSLLYPALFTRFQVVGVTLRFFNDVFLLHFALEAPESIFQ